MDGRDRLRAEADGFARLALENIGREFPTYVPVRVTFGWVPVTLPDGGSYRQVVWVDCRS